MYIVKYTKDCLTSRNQSEYYLQYIINNYDTLPTVVVFSDQINLATY